MITEKLKDVSLAGRMVYAILCAEKYAVEKYPERSWNIIFKALLGVSSSSDWDEWSSIAREHIPEYLFEFDNYERGGFEYISKEEFFSMRKTYEGDYSTLNQIFMKILEIEEEYCYSDIPGYGEESLKIIEQIISILENSGINPPDPSLVSFSRFSERYGWGEHFDGTKLSIVLNKD